MALHLQKELPDRYQEMGTLELSRAIAARKRRLGRRLCILGHHYQRDEIIEQADFVGDSLKLAQIAARQRDTQYIVFCGVRFMAESAAILAAPGQSVILPSMRGSCPMAAMASALDIHTAMDEIGALTAERIVPIAYVNSTAGTKAVVGSLGGACCTSSNASNIFRWALDPGGGGADKILMVPDQHLGRNTAMALGYRDDACAVYDPNLPDGGLSEADVHRATFLLWKGHCYVHQRFTPEHVRALRRHEGDVTVMVHPECSREVVALADRTGSTEQIIRAVSEAKPGSRWAIGTESHLVKRLAARYPDRSIFCLSPAMPTCVQMQQIDLPHLLWVLDRLVEDRPENVIAVPENLAGNARFALSQMLGIGANLSPRHPVAS
ncbi:MAG: quinolinate synthase NadA [Planctomycetota bacterium]